MRLSDSHAARGAWVVCAVLPGLCIVVATLHLGHADLRSPGLLRPGTARTNSIVRTVALQRDTHAIDRPHADPTYAPIGPSTWAERALRRRVVRLARIKWLERRERELREFLAGVHSESPLFEQRTLRDLGDGLLVGPTIVTRDFLGAALVRAIVRNTSTATHAPLLTVHLITPSGERDATVALEPIAPGMSRRVELLVVTRAAPIGVRWSAELDF